MRVTIAGAGAVGRSIAAELLEFGHQLMLIERDPDQLDPHAVEGAEWILADACEVASLEEAGLVVVERVSIEVETMEPAAHYLRTKKEKMGHLLEFNI